MLLQIKIVNERGKYMDDLDDFIEKFIKDFWEELTPEVYLKLRILQYSIKEQSIKKVKNYISSSKIVQELDTLEINGHSYIGVYNRKDYKKISRLLKKCNSIRESDISSRHTQIIELIQYTKLVYMIINKYSYPFLAGFFAPTWTSHLLKRYIEVYFKISTCENTPEVNIKAITCALNAYKKENGISKKNLKDILKDILPSFLENEQYIFYYITFKLEKYPSKNTQTKHVKRRYNRTLFIVAFVLINDFCIYNNRINYVSYRDKKEYVILEHFFSKLQECFEAEQKTPIFFIKSSTPSICEVIDYDDFENIPNYQFILVDSIEQVNNALADINSDKSKKLIQSFTKVKKYENILKKLKLQGHGERFSYLKEMKKKFADVY